MPPASWPEKGAVKAIDLALRYREGLDLVLKGINVDIKAGEKVCVAPLISGSVFKFAFYIKIQAQTSSVLSHIFNFCHLECDGLSMSHLFLFFSL